MLTGKTVLVGSFANSLVTPMNPWYGRRGIHEGDMPAVLISANIISTINKNEFINEAGPFTRISLMVLAGLICTGLIRLFRTRYIVINIILASIVLVVLDALSSLTMFFAFQRDYYLNLDEIAVVLMVASIVSIYWNVRDRNARVGQAL